MKLKEISDLYCLYFENFKVYLKNKGGNRHQLVGRYFKFAKNSKLLTNAIFFVVNCLEPLTTLLACVWFLFYYTYRKIIYRKKGFKTKQLYLHFAPLLVLRSKMAGFWESSEDWLMPITDKEMSPELEIKNKITVFELVSCSDIIRAFFYSVIIVFKSIKYKNKTIIFNNTHVYEFVLTYMFLTKLPDDFTLFFGNHIDRWAILFDRVRGTSLCKIILQHGIESPRADWPVKLNNIHELYSYTKREAFYMKKACLTCDPEVHYFSSLIPFKDIKDYNVKKDVTVLLALYPSYLHYEQEVEIVNAISSDSHVFLKVHPGKYDYSKYTALESENITVLTDWNFPAVDLVITYRSTLGVEYEMGNIDVIYYDSDEVKDHYIEIIKDKVTEKIQSRTC